MSKKDIIPLRWFMALLFIFLGADILADNFQEYEIRVVRPRYFVKKGRLEVGSQAYVVMNQTFIYSYMLSGILTYHLNEYFALEGSGAYGFSVDKDDKRVLKKDFDIRTAILRSKYMADLNVLFTPIYGKYQMPGGKLIYFDTFISGSFGTTGIEYLYDHCTPLEELPVSQQTDENAPPNPITKSYPSFGMGIGQKFYLSQKNAIRWDVRNHMFAYDVADSACGPVASATNTHNNVTMQFGFSHFF